MDAFDYVRAINSGTDLFDNPEQPDLVEKGYVPFLTNRAMSYHLDTVLYANEMNRYPDLPHKAQFSYLISTCKPRKRFSKWPKAQRGEDIELVKKVYKVNTRRALTMMTLLTEDQLGKLRARYNDRDRK